MTIEELSHIQSWFYEYIRHFILVDDKRRTLIELKIDHSKMVAHNCVMLAEEMSWSSDDVRTADALGLLHDTGRFSQIMEFGTFSDVNSINHGDRGYRDVRDSGVLSLLSEKGRRSILDGIRYHNVKVIPPSLTPVSTRFLKLLRDADKLDIYKIIYRVVKNNQLDDHPEITLNIDRNGPISPAVLAEFLASETVSYENIKSLVDFGLTQVSWIYDINYPATFRELVDRRIMEQISEFLPDTEDVHHILEKAQAYIASKT